MNNACTNTDKQLLLLLQQGDEQALAHLMRSHYASLYSYANRFIKDHDHIRDAIQEVFISLWQRRETAGTILSARFYLLGAVKNKVLKIIARKGRGGEPLRDEMQYDFQASLLAEADITDRQLAEENALKLKSVIENLSPRQKEIIYLKFYQLLDHGQIAMLMGLSQQSVYNLLHESIQKLKKCWQSEWLVTA